ncbi:hypothetical protein HYQ46_010377 [Verticillium longisporum]|nr:hypothetical protein HYQ46_010377 [Verticillium longisporum]
MSMKNGSPRREFGSSRANIHKNPEIHRLIDLTMDSTSEGGYSESDEPVFAVKDFLGPQRHRRVIMPPGNEVNGAKGHQAIVIDSSPPHVSHVNGSATERSESRLDCVKHDPVPVEVGNNDMIKIKVKHHGRSKKEQRTFHFMPICIKTERLRVPKYRFHHKEIARNVLTPNTMLKFVPHIRDLEANEERNYNLWLKELERMDASCGFQPMGTREQRVIRTAKKERTAMLALYLDYWLEKLAIPDCTRTTLIRHMASNQSDMAITPLQKSSLYGLHRDNGPADTPQAALSAKMFTEAFDQVFHDGVSPERAVSLRDILLLDKSVDDIVESKKTAKTATQDDAKSPEAFLETYAIMGS